MAQGRSLWRQIFNNFLSTLKPKKYWGELRGTDYMGTDYYESPESLQGNRRPSRWFVPSKPDNFEQEIPPEWEAWLTHRRKEPPTEEEISLNIEKMKKTIENAKLKESKSLNSDKTITFKKCGFPKYDKSDLDFKSSCKKKDQH